MRRPLESFADPEAQKCPFALIERLHAEAPVYLDPVTGYFVVTRYADIGYAGLHPEIFSNKTDIIINSHKNSPGAGEIDRLYAEAGLPRFHTLATNDPPGHGRFRGIVDKIFTLSFVRSHEPYIADIIDRLIDDFIEAGEADLIDSFCIRLPMFVISDQLGVPRSEWLTFRKWSNAVVALINPSLQFEERLAITKTHIEMQQYLAAKRRQYLDAPEDKLLSHLAHATADGTQLTEAEVVNVAEQLLVAGNETTASALAHATALLIRQPELRLTLVESPELIGNFVEEVLRLHSPSPHLYRHVLSDCELSGVKIPAGSVVMLSYLAGNYDAGRYDDPAKVDLHRPGIRKHLAFGHGIHYCIGNQLARAELRLAIGGLLGRVNGIRFSDRYPEPQIAATFHQHALDHLHIAFDKGVRKIES